MVYHKQDILFKGLGHAFIPDLFKYLEMLEKENNENYEPLPCTEIKSLYSGELLTDKYRSLLMDFVYLMADDSYLHFEHFSKNLTHHDIDRTLNYDVELHMENEAIVDSVIIATGDSDKSKTSVDYSNFNNYTPARTMFLKKYDGDKRLKNVKKHIKSNKELTGFDVLDLMIIPFFKTTKTPEEVVIEICELVNEIPNLTEKQENQLFWGLWLTSEIFIPDKKKLEQVRNMTLINGTSINGILRKKEYELREEGRKEGRKEGVEITKNEVARNLIQEGLPISQISRATKMDLDSLHQLRLGK